MKSFKLLCGVVVLVCAVLVATPALCGDGDKGGNGQGVCRLDGAWLGYSTGFNGAWTIVYDSDSHWTGSGIMRFMGDPTLGGFFPVDFLSTTTGTWVRTGRRSFDFTMIHYALAAGFQPQPVFIGKLSGSFVLNGQCDQMEVINTTLAVYDPEQDPFGDEPPLYCFPDEGPNTAQRIPVQPPCEP